MATATTQSNTPTDFITGFKQTFPEYTNIDNATLSKSILTKLSSPDSSSFISGLKQRMPKIASLSNDSISTNLKNSIQSDANTGGLSSGNQATDLGLQTGAQKLGISSNPISKGLQGITNFLTSLPQALGENLGTSVAASGNIQKYSTAVTNYFNEVQKLTTQIQTNQKSGKDVSKLQTALTQLTNSKPQISDFLDQTTLRRLNQSMGQNVEEVLGQSIGTVLDTTLGGGLSSGVDATTEGTTSLLSKVGKGAKIGSVYGSIGAGSQSMAQGQSAGNVVKNTVIGGITGAALGGGTEAVAGGISNKIKTGTVMNLGKVSSKLTGDEGALLSVPDAKEQILDAQKMTKANIKDPDQPTASDVQGNKVHKSILTKAKTQLDAIGKKMEDSLSGIVGKAKTNLSGIVKTFEEELKTRPEVSGYDSKTFNEFRNDLRNITNSEDTIGGYKKYVPKPGEPVMEGRVTSTTIPGTNSSTISEVDKFLRKWQSTDFSSQMKNSSVGSLVDSTIHNINEAVKNAADKAETDAGITGHPYRESNDEYRNLVSDYNDAKGELGTNRASTGKYDKSRSVFRSNATADGSPAWKNLASATGTKLGQPASITSLIEDIYHSANPADAIRNAKVSYNPLLAVARTALGLLGKAENDPDAIVAKMLQIIDEQGKGKLSGKIK